MKTTSVNPMKKPNAAITRPRVIGTNPDIHSSSSLEFKIQWSMVNER
jgi:hypothetical protein